MSIVRHTEAGERIVEDFGIWERMIWHMDKAMIFKK